MKHKFFMTSRQTKDICPMLYMSMSFNQRLGGAFRHTLTLLYKHSFYDMVMSETKTESIKSTTDTL